MSNVEQHISDLLMQHNCVVVPRLGGFVGSYKSAVFAEDNGMFSPPFKEVIFNKALSHNDGLVIDSYSRRYNMNYAEAEKVVSVFVDELLKKVQKGEFVQIGEIGAFRADLSGNLYFIQSEGTNFLAQSFGLDAIHILPLSQSERTSQRFESRNSLFVRMITNRRIAASVAAAVGLFLFSTNITIKDLEKHNYSSLASGFGFDSSRVAEVSATPALVEDTVFVATHSVIAKSQVTPISLLHNDNRKFHLIAASVKNKIEADEMLADYLKAGKLKACIVEADGRFRISIEQFVTKDLALKSMDKYRQDSVYKSVWVFKQK